MATGGTEVKRAHCPVCAKATKVERPAAVWGVGDLVMVLATLGLWVIAKRASRAAWRCAECGSKASGQL